ncbi:MULTISPECIES: multidrug transporter subunit MdtN [Paraburkholderia]|uniref:multidrug transporter subunit MdtN n=1 Tax=Paraburkholderia TaxID=1822464 RepID=UPI00225BC9C6|nr:MULTISPECIES: multidrug transporter subunit MdtN [Paraburkholderia]MCX4161287.1 multidrug transporter subunit MdtN [Paraburkholderia megapolitana]MDN7156783.1 multidrug transporter subunit MdtN [Paraburkholderia sp. CHISQ3]MDQ6493828.1 multidrug transporter subunit MdtN [Paraburkholderia megapolitana]
MSSNLSAATPGAAKPAKRPRSWPAILLIALTVIAAIAVIWRVDTSPRTDDAYAYADTIGVSPEVSGKIVNLAVRDNQAVKQGDLLFEIDPRPYQYALMRAKASLVQLDAQIPLTQRSVNAQTFGAAAAKSAVERAQAAANQASDTLARMEPLIKKGYVSADDLDRARTSQRSALAELAAAEAQARQAQAAVSGVDALVAQRSVLQAEIASAQLNLEYATVRAPFDGRVVELRTSVGEYVSAQKPVFTLIDTRHWYVIANFRENELGQIHPGTRATVYLMSDTGTRFSGSVDSVGYGVDPQDGGGTANGLPNIQRSINWVHVAQRFPVKILIDRPDPRLFRIGTSAVAVLRSGGHDAAAAAGAQP